MKIIQWGNKCRRVNEVCEVLQGSFGVWVVLQKHKNFCFCFLFSTDMLPNRHNDQVLLHQTQGVGGGGEKQESRQTRPIYTVCIVFYPPSLASCLPGNTTGAKTAACGHLLTSIPNGSLPLWQMLYCFDSSLQLFPVGTCRVHGGNGVSGSFHPDAVLVSLLPNLSLKHDKKLMMTQLSGLNAQNTWNDSMLTDSHCGGYGGVQRLHFIYFYCIFIAFFVIGTT